LIKRTFVIIFFFIYYFIYLFIVVQTFTAWCNHWLKEREMKLQRLEKDLTSGVALCHLLELLSGERLRGPSFHVNPRLKVHNLENLNISFSFLERKRIILVNIGPEGATHLLHLSFLSTTFSLVCVCACAVVRVCVRVRWCRVIAGRRHLRWAHEAGAGPHLDAHSALPNPARRVGRYCTSTLKPFAGRALLGELIVIVAFVGVCGRAQRKRIRSSTFPRAAAAARAAVAAVARCQRRRR